ncbi:hypothetical protein HYPSUDRAFT_35069 [Hypholoma sublateritium FD-334 SS-4]|uniref:Uncharacterized protein n=1 Tax=Hypholoma sublateritium (strain FD-334 SS-4) TaxID=945553 RepID=A0A0D2Q830_HYPSF|nr:hypothetical protein HYPSUDRAFT_35069 [Hypholoma sublateritium FD-334 SS-4]
MPEWQHYTNPVIRVLVDTKIATNKDIESVRLRIIWKINPSEDAELGQQDVVFEDMDLLSFSSVAAPVPRKNQTEGLPLKAVYRDTTVGIRYFHSREDGTTPVYRRFQISFMSPSDTNNFVALIKPVCPCRINASSGPSFAVPQNQISSNGNRPAIQAPYIFASANSLIPNRGQPFVPPGSGLVESALPQPERKLVSQGYSPLVSNLPPSGLPLPHVPISFSSSPLRQDPLSGAGTSIALNLNSSPYRRSQSTTPAELQISLPPGNQALLQREPTRTDEEPATTMSKLTTPQAHYVDPPSSYFNPATNVSSAPSTDHQEELQPILASLTDVASIYDLSSAALEQVIEEIIHEEKFVHMVEKISKMISIRKVADV